MFSSTRQVDATCGSLNEGDVFVLDAGKNIFVWVGKEAGLVKQSKGMEIANMINSENKGTYSHTSAQSGCVC